eukprot:gene1732-1838_t
MILAAHSISLTLLILSYFQYLPIFMAKSYYCKGNEYVDGRWVFNQSTAMTKSFICCGWDTGDYLDPVVCGPSTAPKAVNTTNVRGNNKYLAQGGGHSCVCDTREGTHSVQQRERYYWHPRNCTLPRWSAERFCRLLGERRLLFIGDSTNRQTSTTLMSMIVAGGGNCSDHIYSSRSDNLVSKANGSKSLRQIVQEYSTTFVPDVVIMSAGAHVKSIPDYEKNWQAVYDQIVVLHSEFPQIRFLWKTQNPGHVLCQRDSKPSQRHEKRHEKRDVYHWNIHRDYDLMSYDYVQNLTRSFAQRESEAPQAKAVIDVMDMYPLYLRPDAHPNYINDCLHYCLPGPLNIIGVLLLNKLITREI